EANPGLGYTITTAAIAASMATDDEAVFRTEVLCQFVDTLEEQIFERGVWACRLDRESQILGMPILAIDTSPNREWSAISACGMNADDKIHMELVDYRRGTGWVV